MVILNSLLEKENTNYEINQMIKATAFGTFRILYFIIPVSHCNVIMRAIKNEIIFPAIFSIRASRETIIKESLDL